MKYTHFYIKIKTCSDDAELLDPIKLTEVTESAAEKLYEHIEEWEI